MIDQSGSSIKKQLSIKYNSKINKLLLILTNKYAYLKLFI